jgi:hypothetical protein
VQAAAVEQQAADREPIENINNINQDDIMPAADNQNQDDDEASSSQSEMNEEEDDEEAEEEVFEVRIQLEEQQA